MTFEETQTLLKEIFHIHAEKEALKLRNYVVETPEHLTEKDYIQLIQEPRSEWFRKAHVALTELIRDGAQVKFEDSVAKGYCKFGQADTPTIDLYSGIFVFAADYPTNLFETAAFYQQVLKKADLSTNNPPVFIIETTVEQTGFTLTLNNRGDLYGRELRKLRGLHEL